MHKILPITRVIMRRVHRILKIRRSRWRRKKTRKWLLRMAVKLKAPKRAKTTVRKHKEVAMKSPPPFTLKIPVNIVRTLICTGHWSWNVLNAFGTITTKVVQYAITRSPRREITSKRAFFGVTIVERLHTKTRRRWKPISLLLLKRRTRRRNIYFHPFQMAVYFSLFAIVFFNKVFKTVSLFWFYCLRLLVACFNWPLLSY